MTVAVRAGNATCSAKAPTIVWPKTKSPGFTAFTPAPTEHTTPASSLPGMNGGWSEIWYLFWMMSRSGKFTAAACTSTRISSSDGVGVGISSTESDSGGPYSRQTTARTAILSSSR
jgi:hypothetical protein